MYWHGDSVVRAWRHGIAESMAGCASITHFVAFSLWFFEWRIVVDAGHQQSAEEQNDVREQCELGLAESEAHRWYDCATGQYEVGQSLDFHHRRYL